MFALLITLLPGRRNECIDCQKANVQIGVHLDMDVQKLWNSRLDLLESAYRLQEFPPKWLYNPKYSQYRPLFTTQDELIIVKYVM